jgi:uncharacterized protein
VLTVLQPKEVIDSVFVITPDFLLERGLKGLLLDIDNTLVPHGRLESSQTDLARVQDWLVPLQEAGVALRIVSNALPDRIAFHAKALGIKAVGSGGTAGKPLAPAFVSALQETKLLPQELAMLGDQVFTDVWGANRAGLYSILVRPMSDNAKLHTRMARGLERVILRQFGIVW